jgi:hypothetical protein
VKVVGIFPGCTRSVAWSDVTRDIISAGHPVQFKLPALHDTPVVADTFDLVFSFSAMSPFLRRSARNAFLTLVTILISSGIRGAYAQGTYCYLPL